MCWSGSPVSSCDGFALAEEIEVDEPDHIGLAGGIISRTEQVVVDGFYDLALLNLPVDVGVVAADHVSRGYCGRFRPRPYPPDELTART